MVFLITSDSSVLNAVGLPPVAFIVFACTIASSFKLVKNLLNAWLSPGYTAFNNLIAVGFSTSFSAIFLAPNCGLLAPTEVFIYLYKIA